MRWLGDRFDFALDHRRGKKFTLSRGQFREANFTRRPENSLANNRGAVERVSTGRRNIYIYIYIYIYVCVELSAQSCAHDTFARAKCKFGHVILNRPIVQTPVAPDARASITRGGVAGTRDLNAIDVTKRAAALRRDRSFPLFFFFFFFPPECENCTP